ncbi:hypothetical protein J1614_000229 [Plenodomus biglobosus]|nr:hypothetical protein J1614_000229 [Plenodomus biglobosus]
MGASNLDHRVGTHGRYDLRGSNTHADVAIDQNQTASQAASDSVSKKGLRKAWPINRANKATRGLDRIGDTCFRLSGLQALMHLPKFLNWILSHNTTTFPCRPLREVGQVLANKHQWFGAPALELYDCPACVVKRFVEQYWGPTHCTPTYPNTPLPFSHNHPAMQELRDLDQSLYSLTSGAEADAQQDPAECQDRILRACCASTDDEVWRDQFDALFELEVATIWMCGTCHSSRAPGAGATNPTLGIQSLAIPRPRAAWDQDQDPGSVDRSIRERYADQRWEDLQDCAACNEKRVRVERQRLNKVPEILRISLATTMRGSDDAGAVFNSNPIAIPQKLDLTEYQDVPEPRSRLEYQLESVLSHAGGLEGGHWVATVNAATGVYSANDGHVEEHMRELPGPSVVARKKSRTAGGVKKRRTQAGPRFVKDLAFLRSNPQVISGWQFNAVVLTYSRCATRRPLL